MAKNRNSMNLDFYNFGQITGILCNSSSISILSAASMFYLPMCPQIWQAILKWMNFDHKTKRFTKKTRCG